MSLPRPLDGLCAIVTGAGRGLGRAEALELARLGAAVVVIDRPIVIYANDWEAYKVSR
ncbi:SDR family NAD(P)-dependent oxidoreductase, partial [Streptomyces cavourensis]|nr:SDR family NAD(P)-dependent oxidoreductase [Streptomyces cavourensis]